MRKTLFAGLLMVLLLMPLVFAKDFSGEYTTHAKEAIPAIRSGVYISQPSLFKILPFEIGTFTKAGVFDQDYLLGEVVVVKMNEQPFNNVQCNAAQFIVEIYDKTSNKLHTVLRTGNADAKAWFEWFMGKATGAYFTIPYKSEHPEYNGYLEWKPEYSAVYELVEYLYCSSSETVIAKMDNLQFGGSDVVRITVRDDTNVILPDGLIDTICQNGNVVQIQRVNGEQVSVVAERCAYDEICSAGKCVKKNTIIVPDPLPTDPTNPDKCGDGVEGKAESCASCPADIKSVKCDEPVPDCEGVNCYLKGTYGMVVIGLVALIILALLYSKFK